MPVPALATHILQTGGDATVKTKKRKPPLRGNVIETMKFGNVTINVCDDFIAKTPEEIEKILDNLHDVGWIIIESLVEKGEQV